MVDLETLGIGPTSAIVSIGAVEFDPWGKGVTETFRQAVNLESAMKYGRVEAGSLKFWTLSAGPQAREALRQGQEHAVDLDEALLGFDNWITFDVRPNGPLTAEVCIWGDGATFDNVLLRNAYTVTGLDCPWSYKGDRCYRTIKNMVKQKPPAGELEHDALADATSQAIHMQKIVKKLKLGLL